jgi:UDP-3-O-[3-hydroxymyristoyl] N-acetylglucosamine deacetylase
VKISLVKDGHQKTIRKPIEFSGVGLHTNRQVMGVLEPARANTGIKILKLDTGALIPADYNYVIDTKYSTVVGTKDGDTVSTIEHFMAALYAMEVDNCIVKVDGPEMPILDGSAFPVAQKIIDAGLSDLQEERLSIAIVDDCPPLQLDSSSITLGASNGLTLDVAVDFPGTLIGKQSLTFSLTPENFMNQIAPARTFVLKEQIEMLWSAGLALGGSLDNAVVVDGFKVLNEGGLRFPDEFVRHKLIDLIGDFSLLGRRLKCHISAYKPGHTLNSLVIKEISKRIPALTGEDFSPYAPLSMENTIA